MATNGNKSPLHHQSAILACYLSLRNIIKSIKSKEAVALKTSLVGHWNLSISFEFSKEYFNQD